MTETITLTEKTQITQTSTLIETTPLVDLAKLEEAIEYIRPAVQMDGGDLILLGVEGGTVNLQMVGACGGCPMSMMTLKAGIERLLKERVPGVTEVNAT
jgi:Fe-S cluster biogenesis protein NfuA